MTESLGNSDDNKPRPLKIFQDIEFEVEHPLYYTRIVRMPSGRKQKVALNEFEVTSVPIDCILVRYIPRYDRVTFDGRPWNEETMSGAYRVLYETMIWVGESHDNQIINEITDRAVALAETNPDPIGWKEE